MLTETTTAKTYGLLPIVDGPWEGGRMAHAVGTFETEGVEIAMPWTAPPLGVERVRYYRQQSETGFVWSVTIPPNVRELMLEEESDIRRIVG
ncbi:MULTISPECIES: hypothetical protein [Paraburkholderia]|uniref:Uncharacterized protein n=1 Tax=Paraburkholderia madseniana TaxID=2599607 RepID=A0AAP5BM23_9BURK|nr:MULTISPECIES: hypothetical protein [Paraburkholderia]MCX4151992.1 hypothetical protein [Paraburkholderia madseniana]MCX4175590.1 hypothetical protein [Paraburkholderia madseniana]MDN7154920.1 hypothetical protein [Paraburkholderia sp. WS6]MDQ6413803.1 hypothetical protein [Paraburkholderia madseniana]MDQ6463586.1 hypothetical protein [Paraburkholderia madseniana]